MPATQGWNAVISIIGVPTAFLDEETKDNLICGAIGFPNKDYDFQLLASYSSLSSF